jgi:hypothetical protein
MYYWEKFHALLTGLMMEFAMTELVLFLIGLFMGSSGTGMFMYVYAQAVAEQYRHKAVLEKAKPAFVEPKEEEILPTFESPPEKELLMGIPIEAIETYDPEEAYLHDPDWWKKK